MVDIHLILHLKETETMYQIESIETAQAARRARWEKRMKARRIKALIGLAVAITVIVGVNVVMAKHDTKVMPTYNAIIEDEAARLDIAVSERGEQ